jgi:DNA-nicking Smr family endonuclease
MRVDLHGLPFSEAKLKTQIAVAEAWESSSKSIELVHGYNLGTVIKDYVQSYEGLQKDIKRIYPEIPSLKLSDKGLGSTVIKFKRR